VNFQLISLFEPFPLLRHVQIARYLKVTLSYRGLNFILPIIFLFEPFPLLRNIHIRRYQKVTLAYKDLNCYGSDNIVV